MWSDFIEVVFLVEDSYEIAAEAVMDTGADAFAVGIVYIRGEHEKEVDVVCLKHECIAVERPSGKMRVHRHFLSIRGKTVGTIVCVSVCEVIGVDVASDEEVRGKVIALCERVTVAHFADDLLFFRAAPLFRLVEYVYVQLDDVSGVGELLVDRLRANVRAVEVVLAVTNVVDLTVIEHRAVFVDVVYLLAVLVVLEVGEDVFVFGSIIAYQTVNHLFKDKVERAGKEGFVPGLAGAYGFRLVKECIQEFPQPDELVLEVSAAD